MSNRSVGESFIRSSDESTFPPQQVSSSIRHRVIETFVEKEDTFVYSSQPYQQSQLENLPVQTNNFKKNRNAVSFGVATLDYIVQESVETRKRIVSQYMNEIRVLIKQDDFIDGETSQSERYMVEAYKQGNIDYIADAIMTLYASSLEDVHMLVGMLTMISCVPYNAIAPKGQIMAMGLLTNKALSVRDKAIQCFEKWNSKKGLDYLKSIDCTPTWLQKYVEKVMMYIERDGIE